MLEKYTTQYYEISVSITVAPFISYKNIEKLNGDDKILTCIT